MSPILNYSTVAATVSLGGARYIVARAVGDSDNAASMKTADIASVSVDKISVVAGSRLTVEKDHYWHVLFDATDAWSNAGTMVINDASDVTGNLLLSGESGASATVTGNVDNAGSIVLNPTSHSAGNTLTIEGNYISEEGSSVSLGGGDSLTDKLHVTGDTADSQRHSLEASIKHV